MYRGFTYIVTQRHIFISILVYYWFSGRGGGLSTPDYGVSKIVFNSTLEQVIAVLKRCCMCVARAQCMVVLQFAGCRKDKG